MSKTLSKIDIFFKKCLEWFYFQTHEDYRGLERAKEAMVDVAQFTNEVKRDSEHLVVIQKVRVSFRRSLILI